MKVGMILSKNCMSGKNLFLKLWPEMPMENQISVLFSCENLINGFISDFDFLIIDRHE